jgi:cyclophilin family peptidyl-prolyl cis-trans isomerase
LAERVTLCLVEILRRTVRNSPASPICAPTSASTSAASLGAIRATQAPGHAHLTGARRLFALTILLALLPACAAQPDDSRLEQIRAVEDARATAVEELAPMFSALHDGSDLLVRAAVRAIGRLQRPTLADSLAPLLAHADAGVRAEAANALAQSVQPGRDSTAVRRVRELLFARLAADSTHDGTLLRSLGRLPHESAAVAVSVAESLAAVVTRQRSLAEPCGAAQQAAPAAENASPSRMYGTLHGLYSVARRARQLGCHAQMFAVAALGYAAPAGASSAATDSAAWVRELALLALQAANVADSLVLQRGARDPDARVRRLAMRVTRATPHAVVIALATSGLRDTSALVRIDAVRALLLVRAPEACALATAALRDAHPYVRLEAGDALAASCDAQESTALLDSLVRLLPADTADGSRTWHAAARALIALARTAPNVATPHYGHFRMHPVWQVRAALAAAARASGDTAVLLELLRDRDANVREEVITHLAHFGGALRERAVRAGLRDSTHQVLLASAQAAESVATLEVQLLAAALERLTRRRQETSRDPRAALLDRIAERATAADSALVRPYVTDFDTLIARRAAELLTRWTGTPVVPAAQPLPPSRASAAAGSALRITMSPSSGRGSVLVRLYAEEAPATVSRIVALARSGYYDGRTLHRVVPNFVLQGGSPDANEYVGDGPYMRDELGLRSHTRGTLGISTRGRDTGDAQIFINLVDNFRLDHDYAARRGGCALGQHAQRTTRLGAESTPASAHVLDRQRACRWRVDAHAQPARRPERVQRRDGSGAPRSAAGGSE